MICLARPAFAQTTSFLAAVVGNDIWLQYTTGGSSPSPLFDYRLGAGGAIAEFLSNKENNRELLAPAPPPPHYNITDRVIQLATWDLQNCAPPQQPSCTPSSNRWNVNQAGTSDNILHATVSVILTNNNQQVDVYSLGDLQWQPDLRSPVGKYAYEGRVSMLTRYIMQNSGVLQLHRVVLMGQIYLRSTVGGPFAKVSWRKPLHQNWIPFLAGPALNGSGGSFDAVAMHFDATGTPDWWYKWNQNIPTDGFPVQKTWGYSVIYDSAAPSTSTFVAVIFGTRQVNREYSSNWTAQIQGYPQKNTPNTTNGVLVSEPQLYLSAPPPYAVIQSDIMIYPGTALNQCASGNQCAAGTIESLVSTVPAPVVYAPDTTFTVEMKSIVSTLKQKLNCALTREMRTDNPVSRINSQDCS